MCHYLPLFPFICHQQSSAQFPNDGLQVNKTIFAFALPLVIVADKLLPLAVCHCCFFYSKYFLHFSICLGVNLPPNWWHLNLNTFSADFVQFSALRELLCLHHNENLPSFNILVFRFALEGFFYGILIKIILLIFRKVKNCNKSRKIGHILMLHKLKSIKMC